MDVYSFGVVRLIVTLIVIIIYTHSVSTHQCMFPTKHNSLYKIIIIVLLLISIFNQGCCGDLHRPESV